MTVSPFDSTRQSAWFTCVRCGRPVPYRTADGLCLRPWLTCDPRPVTPDALSGKDQREDER